MDVFVESCIRANEEIYFLLQKGFDVSWYEKSTKGAGGDISSKLDLLAEEIFVKHLAPFGKIDSEESGVIGEGEERIIIDPIDGSSNALSGFPFYGTSVAKINIDGILDAAVVCNLVNGDIFFKTSKKDICKGRLFKESFNNFVIVPNTEIGLFEKAYANPKLAALLAKENMKFRSPGAVALSLAYAHTVRFVLYVGRFRIYDFAAGLALCEGLEVIVEEDYVIVSKEKKLAHHIETLIKTIKN